MLQRLIGVFTLSASTFEEIEHDTSATGQAAIVVAIVALLSAIGGGAGASIGGGGSFLGGFFSQLIAVFIGWILFSGVTYLVGTSVFGGKADMGEMLRVVGFAFAPQILGIIPFIGACIGGLWSLAALFVGVQQGLDLPAGKTIATLVISLVVYLALFFCLALLFGGLGSLASGLTG